MSEMYPHKYVMHYKCECYGKPLCNCPRKSASSTYFLENIYDIADTLADVMVICGIHQCKAKAAIDVVIYSFLHYDEIRYRIDAVPRKRLCKEDLIHDLGRKCLMTRMEAQLTYSIIKRAFKAFYHGTSEGGIKNRALEAEAIHTSECLWVHAAKRTAQVFASYEGMFFTAQKSYEAQIRCAYKRLYDRLKTRKYPSDTMTLCACQSCFHQQNQEKSMHSHLSKAESEFNAPPWANKDKQVLEPKISQALSKESHGIAPLTPQQSIPKECSQAICSLGVEPHQNETSTDAELIEKNGSKTSLNLPRCYKCNCPKLVCDCDVDLETGILSAECSQGPFTCRWVRVDDEKDEDRPDPCITRPLEHECPVDCEPTTSQLSCAFECECDCEDCECLAEDSSGYDDDNEDDQVFEMEEEALIEDEDTEPIQYELPDIGILEPNLRFAGCRVQVNHVVEETNSTSNPANIAEVEVHRVENTIKSEPVELSKAMLHKGSGESVPQKMPINKSATASKNPLNSRKGSGEGLLNKNQEQQNKKEDAEAISKILGDLL